MLLRHHPRQKFTPQHPPCSVQIPVCSPSWATRGDNCTSQLSLVTYLFLFCPYGSQLWRDADRTQFMSSLGLCSHHSTKSLLDKRHSPMTCFGGPLDKRLFRSFSLNCMCTLGTLIFLGFLTFLKGSATGHGEHGALPSSRSVHRRPQPTPQRPAEEVLIAPQSTHARVCDGGGENGPLGGSNLLSSKETTVLIQKKNFFSLSKAPVGKFELPTAPQGHRELAAEPFLWISVKS